ncbi:GD21718 [Drosophila simulans]|uniref:GD21718 n=1 Tax=Drosophila simulans TaxID=7240 RepID=B4QAG8_DROSI|nr:GD21718 [Drosophila simulans]
MAPFEFDFETHRYRLPLTEHLAKPIMNRKGNATLECEYQDISRDNSDQKPDNTYNQLRSRSIEQHQFVPNNTDYMITSCYVRDVTNHRELLQQDAISFIEDRLPKKKVKDFVKDESEVHKPSVLIMGLDSTSRINLRRAMPSVYKFVRQPGWFEMQGYNKVGDNTFPNLLAVLTGDSEKGVGDYCDVTKPGCLDSLNFIWKRFKAANYTTAFAEDCSSISTFNYLKPGFVKQPTDYYLRPLLFAIEKQFKVTKDFGFAYCVGRHLSFSYVWDFGQQFIDRFLGRSPMFGFLWSNSFTHDYYEGATALDNLLWKYLKSFEESNLFQKSIVILMSDHGHRYNTLRRASTGYFEERMPMMFIYLPPWFRREYPHLATNLGKNQNRLSSNYDVYMTLQHLLQLDRKSVDEFPDKLRARQCKSCQSLFFELPFNRTCQMAGIEEKWCCCQPTETITNSPYVSTIAEAIVQRMNEHLVNHNLSDLCHNFTLDYVEKADRKTILSNGLRPADKNEQVYIIVFETIPKNPIFEATVRWNRRTHRLLHFDVEDLSRLTSYKNDANCINRKNAKKYCICKDSLSTPN